MRDEYYSIGDRLTDMGVSAPLDRNDVVTEVMVIAKVARADGTPTLGIYTAPGTDWITKRGLLHAAREILEAAPPVQTGDDD